MSQLQVTGEAKIRAIQGPVVANSGVITALNGAASQYVRGDGTLADFPSSTGGGSSVSYYLNSSVSQGTIGGVAYRELSKDPIIGSGTDITISSNGYVANYITDANDPDVVIVPGGNFNCEFYFSVNNNTGSPTTYAELYKYDGSTFTLLGSSSGVPESINQGTTIAPYYFAIPVATATLATTDRLAIRIYVNVDGRTVTLHTENSHLCQVVTTLSKGMVSLNNLTDQSQYLTTGTSGTDFNIVSSGDTHTFNIPSASSSNRGLITTGSQTIAGAKTFSSTATFNTGGVFNNWGISLYDGAGSTALSSSTLTGIYASKSGSITDIVISHNAPYDSILRFSNDVANFTYTFPDLSGTLALTSDLGSYVPYTGATANIDLGAYSITTTGSSNAQIFYANGNVSNAGQISMKWGTGFASPTGYSTLGGFNNGFILISNIGGNQKLGIFDLSSLTTGTQRTYTLPDASGTIALTSNLTGYLPLTGGTLTGKLTVNTGGIDNQIAAIGTAPSLRLANAVTGATINGFIAMAGATNDYITGAVAGDMCIGNQNSGKIIYGFGSGTATAFMTITSTGLGIGTSSPAQSIDVVRTTGANYIGTTSSGVDFLHGVDAAGLPRLFTSGANAISIWTNSAERLRVTSGGNVGIGTSSPSSLFHIYASGTTIQTIETGANYSIINLKNTTRTVNVGVDPSGLYFDAGSTGIIASYAGGSERMRITSGGNVLIGTTSDVGVGRLQVTGGIFSSGTHTITFAGVNVTANTPLYWNNSNGNVGINTSSKRYKTDIVSLTKEQAEIALKLNPVEYTRIETGERELGFIAEEVKEAGLGLIVPEINGEVVTVDYAKISVINTAMIKELKKEIEELKALIAAK